MLLRHPFFISSRLCAAVTIGGATISIEPNGDYSADNREVWTWYVDLADGAEFSASDLKTGCGASATAQEMMETLLTFMGACAESIKYHTPRPMATDDDSAMSLFPAGMHAWLTANSDAIDMMCLDLEENPARTF